jgi:P27 family predicted phage terminase small subunit
MPKGAQPKPSRLKALEGNRSKLGRDRIKDDPQGIGRPRLPRHLTAEQHLLWVSIVESLPAALLTRADEAYLETFSELWARKRKVEALIAKTSEMVQSPNGPVRNPLFVVLNNCIRLMHMLGSDLGLSPGSRARLVAIESEEDDPMALLLGDGDENGAWSTGSRSRN